eukprot:TRINITY_DN14991_c0_g1_i1.p1 TRINITY_DN14991_c0_g1~~TRINITY_DN14991_c0_g1_i1.p1  ORF type:complete len:288 (+),score=34.01 TRINITY_DN14991_c0_g1_i1:31-894(+)
MLFLILATIVLQSTAELSLPRAEVGPDCWFENVCDPKGGSVIIELENETPTAEDCYLACQNEATCNFFTWQYFKVMNDRKICTLLTACNEDSPSTDYRISGPNDCTAIEPCPVLNYNTGDAVWSCDNMLNPYNEPIPSGYTCRTSCGGWLSQDGQNTVAAKSTCTNGIWSTVEMNYPTDVVINEPDTATPCTCVDFTIWYNPNDEPEADFFCDLTDFSTASPETPVNLDPAGECVLMCDNYIVADIQCVNGAWTDANPEWGIGCYRSPPTTNNGATTSTTTTVNPGP